MSHKYDGAEIQVLSTAEGIRKRPGMYFGDVKNGSGLVHMAFEVISNSMNQHLAGHVSTIDVSVDADHVLTVWDDGSGIEDQYLSTSGFECTLTELMMTRLGCGATVCGRSPHWHIGHGVGLVAVCALSEWLVVAWHNEEGHFEQSFARGERSSERRRVGSTERRGFELRFLPDSEIFGDIVWPVRELGRRIQDAVYLLSPKLRISFTAHIKEQ